MKILIKFCLLVFILFMIIPKILNAQVEIIIKPATDDGKDAYINTYNNYSNGSHQSFIAAAWTYNGTFGIGRSFIQFPLPELPANYTNFTATLNFYYDYSSPHVGHGGNNACKLERITGDWTELGVNWGNQPSVTTEHSVFLPTSQTSTQDYPNIDVTQLVLDMYEDAANSFGFRLSLIEESIYRSMIFASSDHPDETIRPSLVIYYDTCSTTTNFTYESNCINNIVQFTDLSSTPSGFINQWIWSFGDGTQNDTINFPSNPNVQHLYSCSGVFNVSLITKTNLGCVNSFVQLVEVNSGPEADFNYTGNCSDLSMQFIDACVLNGLDSIVGWQWDFGDTVSGINNYSNLPDPSHVFSSPGNFEVTLIVENITNCTDTIVKQVISYQMSPVEFNYSLACLNEVVYFSPDTNIMNIESIESWLWDFGDGTTSSVPNFWHIYIQPGMYSVTLTVTDTANCTNSVTHSVSVVGPPEVFFTFPAPACTNSPVQFTDMTNNDAAQIISWLWDFGDGQTSTLQNPMHSFNLGGDYQVCLTVQNECSNATYCETITIFPDPISHFTYSFIENFVVAFLNQSQYANSMIWDFGDGQTSDEPNPIHTYNSPGDYLVCLSVTNECNTESECDTIFVIDNVGLEFVSSEEALIELFPNPAKEEIYIKTKFLEINQVEIFNSAGVLTDRIQPEYLCDNYHISLHEKVPGLYLLRILTNQGTVTKNLIVQ